MMAEEYAGAVSKCKVPMWQMGLPAGICGRAAYGLERHYNPKEPPYSQGWRCDHHGGPSEDGIRLITDGYTKSGRPMWMAYFPEFINLAESVAGFGPTKDEAIVDLHNNLAKPPPKTIERNAT
jgi:hypothetical protein